MLSKIQNVGSQQKNKPLPVLGFKRGLSRNEAAGYVGVSASLFDKMVKDGRMPKPVRINSRVIWDREDLDAAFDNLKDEPTDNPWEDLG
jgi:predicted DNA-binding transcriptional regulator AlpA